MARFRDIIQHYKKEKQKGQLVPVRITMTFDAYVDEVVEEDGTPTLRFQVSDVRFHNVVYDDWSGIYVDLKESDVERIELR